jgi:putative transposase
VRRFIAALRASAAKAAMNRRTPKTDRISIPDRAANWYFAGRQSVDTLSARRGTGGMNGRTPKGQTMPENLCDHLVRRLRHLPADKLPRVAELLTILECGDSSPHFSTLGGALHGSSSVSHQLALPPGIESQSGKDWPHAPVHRIDSHGVYMVTAGTLHKHHWFRGSDRLHLLESAMLRLAKQFGWQLEAWAVFSNHYHFVGIAQEGAQNLKEFIRRLHGETAHYLNQLDNLPGRSVWHNYRDTQLTFEKSYLARLHYVHDNPVKHGLVPVANQYRWCSAAWFERTATPAQIKTICSFKTNKVHVSDDFDPV